MAGWSPSWFAVGSTPEQTHAQLDLLVVYQVVGYYVTGSVQVVGIFDVAARLCAGDEPIAAMVGISGHR